MDVPECSLLTLSCFLCLFSDCESIGISGIGLMACGMMGWYLGNSGDNGMWFGVVDVVTIGTWNGNVCVPDTMGTSCMGAEKYLKIH